MHPGPFNPPPVQPQAWPQPQPQPGASQNAILALVLAIAGLMMCGCVTSIPAIFVARSELKAIDAGSSSPAGRGLATAAFWIGVIDTVLVLLVLAAYVVLVVFGVLASVAL
jgi:hypothetical protein